MRSWVGIEVGKVIKNVCCVVMSVRVSVMCCVSVQHNNSSSRVDFLLNLQEKLGNGFESLDALDTLEESSFILGSELWEEHFDSLLHLVKDYVINIWEVWKLNYDSSQSQSSTGDLRYITGIEGQSGNNNYYVSVR